MSIVGRLLICVFLMVFCSNASFAQNPPWQDPGYDIVKYDFAIKTLEGKQLRLSSLKGKIVVLNLWATWCGPCRFETPGLVSVYQKLSTQKEVIFLGISVMDEEEAVRDFVKKYNVPYLIANDADDAIMKQYRCYAIPESYLIDRNGKLFHHFSGAVSEKALEEKIRTLLTGTAKPQ